MLSTNRQPGHEVVSASWETGETPRVAVVVSTFRRPHFLPPLVAALEDQDLAVDHFEVVVVDNGSEDETWDVLLGLAATTGLRLQAVRLDVNQGPARGRNAGAARVRAPVIAITDDDCLPAPGWLRAIATSFEADQALDVAQGQVHADPATLPGSGPWDHTIWVTAATPFFETCNVAYRRSAFERVGGFDEDDRLLAPASGRAFGEDACLAWKVQASGGASGFLDDALVYHRVVPGSFAGWLHGQRHLVGFPGLARRSPLVRQMLLGGIFLNRVSAAFDLALVGIGAAALSRRAWPASAALPWLRLRWPAARLAARGDAARTVTALAQYWIADLVALASMVEGGVRHRKLLL